MPRYLVERTFPRPLDIPMDDKGERVCAAIVENDALCGVTWIVSFVTLEKLKTFCICDAPTPEAVRRAAYLSHWPVDRVTEVRVLHPHFFF